MINKHKMLNVIITFKVILTLPYLLFLPFSIILFNKDNIVKTPYCIDVL